MKPLNLIQKFYPEQSKTYSFLVPHSVAVTKKALEVAKRVEHLHPDFQFIEEAAMLHDIGIFMTDAAKIGCLGKKPYICHGYLGRELLEKEGFPKHALVCERHVGTGLSIADIDQQKLSLPRRDMQPQSLEEKIICFADKFFSKNSENLTVEKSIEQIQKSNLKFGEHKVKIFEQWLKEFGY